MRKRIVYTFVPLLLVCILFAQMAQAAEPRAAGGTLDLSFQGKMAICTAICQGNSAKDSVKATLTLYQGSTYIDSWSNSGIWEASIYGEHEVESGKTYRLELSYFVNGGSKQGVSVTNRCP